MVLRSASDGFVHPRGYLPHNLTGGTGGDDVAGNQHGNLCLGGYSTEAYDPENREHLGTGPQYGDGHAPDVP